MHWPTRRRFPYIHQDRITGSVVFNTNDIILVLFSSNICCSIFLESSKFKINDRLLISILKKTILSRTIKTPVLSQEGVTPKIHTNAGDTMFFDIGIQGWLHYSLFMTCSCWWRWNLCEDSSVFRDYSLIRWLFQFLINMSDSFCRISFGVTH